MKNLENQKDNITENNDTYNVEYVKKDTRIKYFLILCAAGLIILALMNKKECITETINAAVTQKKLPIYCVNTDKKQVALSFDAAWGNEDTRHILDVLEKNNVKVTFFMTGGWVEKFPEDVKAIAKAGHDLGNHSENHKQMSKLSNEECRDEIMKTHEKVKKLTGKEMILFRPPYGDYNNTVIDVVNSLGYHCIQWDVDTIDIKVINL